MQATTTTTVMVMVTSTAYPSAVLPAAPSRLLHRGNPKTKGQNPEKHKRKTTTMFTRVPRRRLERRPGRRRRRLASRRLAAKLAPLTQRPDSSGTFKTFVIVIATTRGFAVILFIFLLVFFFRRTLWGREVGRAVACSPFSGSAIRAPPAAATAPAPATATTIAPATRCC